MRYFSFFVAWRYFVKKKSLHAIQIIMWVSISSSIIGTASLLIAMSIFNGFEENITSQIKSVVPDLMVFPTQGQFLELSLAQNNTLCKIDGIAAVSKKLQVEAVMQANERNAFVHLVGVDENFSDVVDMSEYLSKEKWNSGTSTHPLLTISYLAANQTLIDPDYMMNPITLSTIVTGKRISSNLLSQIRSDLAHPYAAHYMSESDQIPTVYTHQSFVRNIGSISPHIYSSVMVSLQESANADFVKTRIASLLPNTIVRNRFEQHETLYNMMRVEKKMMMLILTFILIVATTGSVGAMRILFAEKLKHATVLHFLGCSMSKNLSIFMFKGFIVSVSGLLGGFFLALIMVYSQQQFGWLRVSSTYYVDVPYPIQLLLKDVLLVLGIVSTLSMGGVALAMRGIRKQLKFSQVSMLSN